MSRRSSTQHLFRVVNGLVAPIFPGGIESVEAVGSTITSTAIRWLNQNGVLREWIAAWRTANQSRLSMAVAKVSDTDPAVRADVELFIESHMVLPLAWIGANLSHASPGGSASDAFTIITSRGESDFLQKTDQHGFVRDDPAGSTGNSLAIGWNGSQLIFRVDGTHVLSINISSFPRTI